MNKKTLGVVLLSIVVIASVIVALLVIPKSSDDNDVIIRIKVPERYVGMNGTVEVSFGVSVAYCYCSPVTVYTYRTRVHNVSDVIELKIPRKWIQAGIDEHMYHDVVRDGNMAIVAVELISDEWKLPLIYAKCAKVVGTPITAYDFPDITI